jgi:hypothetical protein
MVVSSLAAAVICCAGAQAAVCRNDRDQAKRENLLALSRTEQQPYAQSMQQSLTPQ